MESARSASGSRSLSKSTLRPRSFSMVTITKPNVQRNCAAKYPASETKHAVRVLDRSSKCLGRGRLDPLLDVRFAEQALRLQKLADLCHGAMDNWVGYDGTERAASNC